MFRIIDKRCTGKTSRLLLLAKETGAIIVCSEPRYVQMLAETLGIEGIEAIPYRQYLSNYYDYSNRKILIDELEGFLQQLSGNCIGYSISI